jgi:anti-sigma factor RsiW
MRCDEFRDLMFERLSGELDPERDAACDSHEKGCAICRAELAQFRSVQARLRAGWPSEDPLPMQVVLPQNDARRWFDAATLWFSRASAGLVAASLLFLVLVRPSVQVGRSGIELSFGPAVTQTASASTLSEAQVKALVQAAVDRQIAQAKAVAPVSGVPTNQAVQSAEVANQVRQLQRTQATLWEEVQQHGLSLESLWRSTAGNAAPPAGSAQ